jgi:hypothetical protein
MSKSDCCSTDNKGTNVTVQIDVGIIFGTRCYKNLIIDNKDA